MGTAQRQQLELISSRTPELAARDQAARNYGEQLTRLAMARRLYGLAHAGDDDPALEVAKHALHEATELADAAFQVLFQRAHEVIS